MSASHCVANPLDNPIWHALTSDQSHLAEGAGQARRYPHDIGPLAGLPEQSSEAYADLAPLSGKDSVSGKLSDQLVLFLDEPPHLPSGWVLDVGGELTQMVFEPEWPNVLKGPADDLVSSPSPVVLGEGDIPAMLALTRLCKPGPFRQNTHQLGLYLGIYQEGHLVAMSGERLNLSGYTEISAVCTHPDYQGRGYARQLIHAVARQIQARGKTPFLHTRPDNTGAIRVYEALGFRQRRLFHLAVIRAV